MVRVPHPIKVQEIKNYREPFSVRLGRYMMLGGAVLGGLIVLYVLAWFVTALTLRDGIQDWFAARHAEGYLAEFGDDDARISGFPFYVNARLQHLRFAPPVDERGRRAWVWASKGVDVSVVVLPWLLDTVQVDLKDQQSLLWKGKRLKGRAGQFDLSFNWLSKGVPEDLRLDISGLHLESGPRTLRIRQLNFLAGRQSEGDYSFDLSGEDWDLPYGLSGIGDRLSEILLRGKLTHDFAIEALSNEELAQWRDRGGTLEVERMLVDYSPLSMQGNGTLALDGDLQIVGAFSARIQGFFETVERLRRGGIIRGPDASMAKVVLGMLAKHPRNGGPATISLPLTIQDRALFAGPVRLITIPQLKWWE